MSIVTLHGKTAATFTNTMGLAEQDFEKGEANGSADALKLLEAISPALLPAAT